ncbi:MAG: adenylate/guanylate cyclase domain-containing protein [Gammaproteobacteria bacterium]|nr:adenylate/guanylate cyclase domain-containing protein [Gammaproteobacteria bacterium]
MSYLKRSGGRTLIGLMLLLLLAGHSADFYQIGVITKLDAIFYDAKLWLTLPQGVDERVVIIDIDEKSLAEEGRWPWGRDKLANLIDKLFDQQGALIVGFDVVFAEPDISSGLQSLESLAQGPLQNNVDFQQSLLTLRPQLDYDARFAKALSGRKVVLGYYLSSFADATSSGALPEPAMTPDTLPRRPEKITSWSGYGGNLPLFQQAAAAAGHFNPLIDFDGISRRIPLLAEFQGNYYESLSLAMLRTLFDSPPIFPGYAGNEENYAGLEWLEIPTEIDMIYIPVDENVAALIPYRGPQGSFPYISASDLLHDRLPAGTLDGRIVIVGTSAPGLMDLRATPLSTAYAGVEIHANLIAGMLDGTIKYKPGYLIGADLLQLLLIGLILIFILPRLSPIKATLTLLLLLLLLTGGNLYLWLNNNLVMPFANAALLSGLLFTLNMSWGYFVESRNKRQFTALFGQYVPPELVDEMAKNPENYTMDGRKAELSVLFSDVRGFTTISEGLQPDELATLMNEYLGAMTEITRRHGGTLDKYIGDAIMAFWGAPVANSDHAYAAVITAMNMQKALTNLNPRLEAKGWPALKIGVGINTGTMTVGDMGSPVRKSYTVMGDAVNLGSRLEGITKQYGVGIIIGEGTREQLGDRVIVRELDKVRVKGKAEPITIYEPLAVAGELSQNATNALQQWQQALAAYRQQDWQSAETVIRQLAQENPHYLYDLYLERIAHYRLQSPPVNWDGVTTFATK